MLLNGNNINTYEKIDNAIAINRWKDVCTYPMYSTIEIGPSKGDSYVSVSALALDEVTPWKLNTVFKTRGMPKRKVKVDDISQQWNFFKVERGVPPILSADSLYAEFNAGAKRVSSFVKIGDIKGLYMPCLSYKIGKRVLSSYFPDHCGAIIIDLSESFNIKKDIEAAIRHSDVTAFVVKGEYVSDITDAWSQFPQDKLEKIFFEQYVPLFKDGPSRRHLYDIELPSANTISFDDIMNFSDEELKKHLWKYFLGMNYGAVSFGTFLDWHEILE